MEYERKLRVVLDNGSAFLKIGGAGCASPKAILPNCVGTHRKRQNVKHLADQCYTLPEYFCHRPFSNGLLTDLDLQRDLWERAFGKGYLNCATEGLSIFITEPYLSPSAIRHAMCEILFEDFQFNKVIISPAQMTVPYSFWGRKWVLYDTLSSSNNYSLGNLLCYTGDTSVTGTTNVSIPSIAQISQDKKSDKLCSFGALNNQSQEPEDTRKVNASSISTTDPNLLCLSKADVSKLNCKRFYRNPCCLVLDCGFSCCQTMPFYEYKPVESAALRIDLGGQHLNAFLKNLTTYRSINLGQNELLVQHIKEKCCYVSQNFLKELCSSVPGKQLSATVNGVGSISDMRYEFALPDYNVKNKALLMHFFQKSNRRNSASNAGNQGVHSTSHITENFSHLIEPNNSKISDFNVDLNTEAANFQQGNVETADCRQTITLGNERILVPEVLFNPQDVSCEECGVAELIYRSISLAPLKMQPLLARQILLVGGTSNLPGFRERIWRDLRKLLPQHWEIIIYQHEDSQLSVWNGASEFCKSDELFEINCVTKGEFLETGQSKFNLKVF